GAVWAEQAHDLAGIDLQGDMVQGSYGAVGLEHSSQFDSHFSALTKAYIPTQNNFFHQRDRGLASPRNFAIHGSEEQVNLSGSFPRNFPGWRRKCSIFKRVAMPSNCIPKIEASVRGDRSLCQELIQ